MTIEPFNTAANLDRAVSERTRERIADGMSDNTRRAYDRNLIAFTAWCRTAGRTPLPCTAETLAEYVTELCDAGRAPSTVEQIIATIRTAHRLAGFEHQPDTAAARLVLRSHRRERAQTGKRTRKAPPVVLDALRAIMEACDPTTAAGLRDRVLLILGFALMGRRSELAALDLGDVSETPDGLLVHIRMSKTDQDAIGEEVAIPHGQYADTDPVRILAAWRTLLAEHDITNGRLLRSVDRHGRIGDSVSTDGINRAVRAAAVRAKLPDAEKYTAHSLRAGGATASYKAGAAVSVIAKHGRWAEGSPVVLGYIRAVDKWTSNPMNGVGL
jgi:site-specific recombinase XerD